MSGTYSGTPIATIGEGVWVRCGPQVRYSGTPIATIGEGVWVRAGDRPRTGWSVGTLRFGGGNGWS